MLAIAAILVPATPAAAATVPCSQGVTVVVDFASLGGAVAVGCAPGDPASGYDALHAAGFTTAGTQHDGPAFVCRINGKPTPAQDACVLTPPATAYWSYWHAQPGGAWTYSPLGAMSYNPAPGSVEGWAFGAGAPPSAAPPAPIAPTTTAAQPPSQPAAGQPSASAAAPIVVDRPPGTSTSDAATASSSAGTSATADDNAAAEPTNGFPVGTGVGIALVVALAAVAAVTAWRRRRSG